MCVLSMKPEAHANGLPGPTALSMQSRVRVAAVLGRLLVETVDVALCVRHVYWHRRGVDFLSHFEMLESIGGVLDSAANVILRRLETMLGLTSAAAAVGTVSSFSPYPVEIARGQDHLKAAVLRIALLSADFRQAIRVCGRGGDPVTAEILAAADAELDRAASIVELYLSEQDGTSKDSSPAKYLKEKHKWQLDAASCTPSTPRTCERPATISQSPPASRRSRHSIV